ncbi:MAG: response regulator [Geobacter sp.]|nr:response regulator [Geobacter sp.]
MALLPLTDSSSLPVILCVDDTPVNLKLFKALLGQEFHLLLAEDGHQALELLGQTTPDLILLDLMMPVLDGFELLRRIRSQEQFATLPVLVVTAMEERRARLASFEQGATDFVSKPFDRLELVIRCRNLVQLHRTTRQLLEVSKALLDRSEQTLQEQRLLHRSVINTIEDLIWHKNTAGIYQGCNPAFARLVGRTPEQVSGLQAADLCAPEPAAPLSAAEQQVLETGTTCTIEHWCAFPTGQPVLFETKISPLRDDNLKVTGLIGISRDITGRKQLEGRLTALNEQLEQRVAEEVEKNRIKDSFLMQQEKLASIGQLAAGVAHEINNPMGFIMSNLNSLREYSEALGQYCALLDTTLADGHREELRQLRTRLDIDFILRDLPSLLAESIEGAERVRRIVHDLKGFARSDSDELELADLNEMITSTLNLVRSELRYVADLDLDLQPLPQLCCRPHQIKQVISNLLINAAQAMHERGTITVSTRCSGDQLQLQVRDTGSGIPPEMINRIFEPFFTTKPVGKGTGLGLAISYDIVHKHDGEIMVTSEIGVGTTFTVRLPVQNREGVNR